MCYLHNHVDHPVVCLGVGEVDITAVDIACPHSPVVQFNEVIVCEALLVIVVFVGRGSMSDVINQWVDVRQNTNVFF